MTQTLPMEMMEAMSQTRVDELSHHGILGMKWYVRRFQKYPAGYTGDGKYVGPGGEPRKATLREKIKDRKFNKIKSVLDAGVKSAVDDGDKKKLNVLKPTMTTEEYKEKYAELVSKGVRRAVQQGDSKGLRKFKEDMTGNEYKDAKTLLKFNDAVNKMDTSAMNKQMSKIKNDDLKVAAERIATITSLQSTKIEALKTESEASARIAKTAKTVGNIADLTSKGLSVLTNIQGFKQKIHEGKTAEEERIKAETQKKIEKAINTGDPRTIAVWRDQMTSKQREEANKNIYDNNKSKIIGLLDAGDYNGLVNYSNYLTKSQMEELISLRDKAAANKK